MPIDPYIASGVKLPQFNLPDYGAELAQFSQLQSARTQNELAKYQLGAAQRGEEENNQLRALFSRPDIDRSSPDFVRQIYAISPEKGQTYTKNLLEERVKSATLEKTESDLLAADIERSSQALANAKSLPEYTNIHNAIHDPKTRLGKYFTSIGFDKTKSDALIAQAANDPTGQTFLSMRATSGLKGKELADHLRTQAEAAQVAQPQAGAMPAPAPTGNALVAPVAGVSNAMVAQPAPTTFAAGRLATVEKEIGQMQNVLASYPGNKLATERLKAAVEERNKLVAEDLASRKFEQEKKTAVEYVKTLKGVLRVNKADGTSELVLGPDGNPVTDVSAAQAIEAKRHANVIETQGASRINLENKRVNLEQERVNELKNDKVVANTITDEAGNVRRYNRYGEQIGETKTGEGKPSASFTKLRDQRAQLGRDLGAAITELTDITKDGGLIDQSTGSGVGRLVDVGKGFFGGTTPGAIATAKLKPIQDLVLKTIPRFEGPQSDKDTQSYKEAAGQLADPNMPTAIRKEAAKTVLRLMTARKNQFVTPEMAAEGAGASGGGVKFLGFEP